MPYYIMYVYSGATVNENKRPPPSPHTSLNLRMSNKATVDEESHKTKSRSPALQDKLRELGEAKSRFNVDKRMICPELKTARQNPNQNEGQLKIVRAYIPLYYTDSGVDSILDREKGLTKYTTQGMQYQTASEE